MRRRLALLCVLALALALAIPGAASAADTSRYSTLGASAFGMVWEDDAEMPELFVGVFGGTYSSKWHTPGTKPEKGTFQDVSVWVDWPADEPDGISTSVFAVISPYDVGVDRKLTDAGVQAVVEGTRVVYYWQPCADEPDCWEQVVLSEGAVEVEVDMAWTGVGEITKERFFWKEMTSAYKIMDRTIGRYRAADVAGSILVDGVDVTEGVELYGDLYDSKGGSTIIGEPWYW